MEDRCYNLIKMTAEFDPRKLGKWEMFLGLGKGKYIHINSEGKVTEFGKKILPSYVSLLYPLVSELVPEEFEETGGFPDKLYLESKLEEVFPNSEPKEIYSNVCARLVKDGIKAKEASKVILDMSPFKTYLDTGRISKDIWQVFQSRLTNIILDYYPSSVRSKKYHKNLQNQILNTKDKDEIPF